jgi:hypothetical protein
MNNLNNELTLETSLITLNTINKLDNSTISAPAWFLNAPLVNAVGFKVKSAVIPLAVYPIDSRNNKMYFYEGATLRTITLTSENYTGTQLATELQTQLSSGVSNTYTVSYNSQKNNITFNMTGGSAFKMTSGSSCCNYEVGITSNDMNSTIATTGASLVLSNQIDVSGVKNVFLCSSSFSTKYTQSGYTILASIPTTTLSGNVSTYTDNSNDYITINEKYINQLNIVCFDERMRPLTLQKDYLLTLAFQTL